MRLSLFQLRQRSSSFFLLLLTLHVLLLTTRIRTVTSYPVIAHLDEEREMCFRFNVRGHDEAHLLVTILPNEDQYEKAKGNDAELEEWYVTRMFEMSQKKDKKKGLPSTIEVEMPEIIKAKQKEFEHHKTSPILVRLTDNPSAPNPTYKGDFRPRYHVPLVVNHIKKYIKGINLHKKVDHRGGFDEENLEGYGLCFKNENTEHHVHIVFDVVLDSDQLTTHAVLPIAAAAAAVGGANGTIPFDKQKHLSPLERALDRSIVAAHSVLREMKNMDKREQRMRQAADSINDRVRYFSYLSIAVLLVVTYIQVGYLKRYFHKKKLL